MARKHVAKHVKRIESHLKRHRKHVYKVFKKMARHPGCYKGGMMLYGAGMKKKGAKGGMMLYGAGMRKPRKRKLPAWVGKPVPKSGWPRAPAGLTKKASGWWARHKKKAQDLHKRAKDKAKAVWEHGKKVVAGVADHVADRAFAKADALVDQVGSAVDDHIDRLGDSSQKYMDNTIDKYSGRASSYVSRAAKRGKRGSGIGSEAKKYAAAVKSRGYGKVPRLSEMYDLGPRGETMMQRQNRMGTKSV